MAKETKRMKDALQGLIIDEHDGKITLQGSKNVEVSKAFARMITLPLCVRFRRARWLVSALVKSFWGSMLKARSMKNCQSRGFNVVVLKSVAV